MHSLKLTNSLLLKNPNSHPTRKLITSICPKEKRGQLFVGTSIIIDGGIANEHPPSLFDNAKVSNFVTLLSQCAAAHQTPIGHLAHLVLMIYGSNTHHSTCTFKPVRPLLGNLKDMASPECLALCWRGHRWEQSSSRVRFHDRGQPAYQILRTFEL